MVAASLLLAAGATMTLLCFPIFTPQLPKRRNFTGRNVPTSAGLLFIPIILVTLVLAMAGVPGVGGGKVAYLVYAFVAAVVGFVDDIGGGSVARGFRGHIGALKHGRVTTGFIKVVVLGGGAVVFGMAVYGFTIEALVAGFLLAGSVNLANLLDLRPGRALKFLGVPTLFMLLVAPYVAVLAVIGIVGGALGLFYFDLKERIMLGDAGAAVYGSIVGYLVVIDGPGPIWWVAGAVILGLTLLAEVSSVSRIIQEVGVLRRFDEWGRGGDE